MTAILTEDDVRQMIRDRAGPRGVGPWCDKHAVNRGYVSLFLAGKRGAGDKILSALGLKRIYQPATFVLQSSREQAK